MKKQTVMMTVGIPGSGKSTWAARYAVKHGMAVCSSDEVRGILYGDESVVGDSDDVFETLYDNVDDCLAEGLDVIIDNTGLTRRSRSVMRTYHDRGFHTIAVVFDTPLETCLLRNRRRCRNVPEDVITSMHSHRTEPSPYEGFDEIIHLRT